MFDIKYLLNTLIIFPNNYLTVSKYVLKIKFRNLIDFKFVVLKIKYLTQY